jgi:hypothetical protein
MSREIRITSRKLAGHQAPYGHRAEAGDRVVVTVGNRKHRLLPLANVQLDTALLAKVRQALRVDESISDSEAAELALSGYLALSNER